MANQTISDLSRSGSTPLRIPARPPLFNRAWLELARAGSWIYLAAVLAISAATIGAIA